MILLGRGIAWLDTGTPEGLLRAAEYVEAVQNRQGLYISCIEEIAWRKGFISSQQLRELGQGLSVTDYGQYLVSLLCGAKKVITDSGGLQKEAYFAKVPALVMMPDTSLIELIEAGWNMLVDADAQKIDDAAFHH